MNLKTMKIKSFIILSFLLSLFISVDANCLHFHKKSSIPINKINELIDTTTNKPIAINISKIILSGKEDKIKKFFREVSLEQLGRNDSGTMVKSFRRLNTNDKVSRTIWILEVAKNRDAEFRNYIYTVFLKVDYGKPSILLNHMINNYFVNYNEGDTTLTDKVRKLQRKMNR